MRRALICAATLLAHGPAARAATYLCFGDSNTAGDTWVGPLGAYLARTGAATMVNEGLGSEATREGRTRLTGLVGGGTYDYVLIMEGTNDLFRWRAHLYDEATTQTSIEGMVDAVRARGATPILATVLPRVDDSLDPSNAKTIGLNDIIRGVASRKGVTVAEVYANVAPYATELIYRDELHAGPIGYDLVAEAFGAAITGGNPDLTPPIPMSIVPEPGDPTAGVSTNVEIWIAEPKSPPAYSSGVLSINGAPVTYTLDTTSRGGQVGYIYDFPTDLDLGVTVSVSFTLTDAASNTLNLNHNFSTGTGNGTNGDVDGSGRVDGLDLAYLAGAFGAGKGDPRYWYNADIDASGFVDGGDLSLMSLKFGEAPR